MASSVNSVWAIDIGSNALKALHLEEGEDGLEVVGFDFIEHSRILSSEDVEPGDRAGIVAKTMQTFTSRNEVDHSKVAISVAGHNSFARFIKLPPVDTKDIPKVVQFEAVQQIPFDINEVEFAWQLMDNPESDDIEVGLFAIKNELIAEIMDHFAEEGMQVGYVQIAPIALHNYANYERSDIGMPNEKAMVILDIGAENTTLVVCTKHTVWQRSIRIGGNTFTEAIQDKFDIGFRKAEKLKRTALLSKYVRQIFSAMKPIYTDLGSEVQRSLGFYASSGPGRDKGFSKIIAIGGGMKLKGVAKYLQQTLGIAVEKPASLSKIKLGEGLSETKFHENIPDFMIAYGLGVQVLDDDPAITSNLLPRKIVRAMEWARKAKVLTIAASIFLAVSVLGLGRAVLDNAKYSSGDTDRKDIKRTLSKSQEVESKYNAETAREAELTAGIDKALTYFSYRDVVPELAQSILSCLPSADNTQDQEQKKVHEAFTNGDIAAIKSIAREDRQQLFITAMTIDYTQTLSKGQFKDIKTTRTGARRGRSRTQPGPNEDYGEDTMGYGGDYGRPGVGGPGGYGGYGGPAGYGNTGGATGLEGVVKEEDGPGFVVTIEGYSPYKDIDQLLDPPHAGSDQKKWGFVTRLKNLEKYLKDKDCPFKLYPKKDIEHFKQVSGAVKLDDNEMPGGIGEVKEMQRVVRPEVKSKRNPMGGRVSRVNRGGRYGGNSQTRVDSETVLIDPMTREEMSQTFDFFTQEEVDSDPKLNADDLGTIKTDKNGESELITRDHWFRINVKFLWKDSPNAPKDDAGAGGPGGSGGPGMPGMPGGPGGPGGRGGRGGPARPEYNRR